MTSVGTYRLVVVALFLLIYGDAAGRGFISDDFAWIAHGRLDDGASVARVLTSSVGFYRPLTSLSFGLNHLVFGMNALGFGLTNLALALLCAFLLIRLASQLNLTAHPATGASALWLFNFHGINMSVLWLSGRTSLLLTAFSLASVLAMFRGRPVLSWFLAGAAMLSKEEAVLLPVMMSAWFAVGVFARPGTRRMSRLDLGGLWIVLGAYLVLRASSGAFWPNSAPSYYRMTLDPSHVSINMLEYADRSLTFSAIALVLAMVYFRRAPVLTPESRGVLLFGAIWFVCGFALTVFLPVRSSLYALYPSIGSCLIASHLIASVCRDASDMQLRNARAAVFILLLALLPIYWARTVRWTELADLSASVIAQLENEISRLPEGSTIVIVDDETTRANLTNAWAGLTREVSQVAFGGHINIELRRASDRQRAEPAGGELVMLLHQGRLARLP